MKHYYKVLFFVLLIFSCYKPDDGIVKEPFIATSTSFGGYIAWKLEATKTGTDTTLAAAHQGLLTNVTRKIYYKNGQSRVDSTYPIGTLIVKESRNDSAIVEIVAMAKRGSGFNTEAGNWEWFLLENKGGTVSIKKDSSGNKLRGGAAMMGGMCNNCHKAAKSKDFTFSK